MCDAEDHLLERLKSRKTCLNKRLQKTKPDRPKKMGKINSCKQLEKTGKRSEGKC